MRRLSTYVLVFVVLVNLSLFAAAGNGYWGFENPVAPSSPEDIPFNANFTGKIGAGWLSYGRQVDGQLIHSTFQKNSNSCASCHMTHTGGSKSLLFQSSGYNSCVTCHDGSFGPYDVLNGSVAAGAFYDDRIAPEDRDGVSYHLATGARTHGDAYGALLGADETVRYTRRGEPVIGEWNKPFTCSSCHVPHSSFNDRLLHFNINGAAGRQRHILQLQSLGSGVYGINNNSYLPWLSYSPERYPQYAVRVYDGGGQDITEHFQIYHGLGEILRISPSPEPVTISFLNATQVRIDSFNKFKLDEAVTHKGGIVEFCTSCHVGFFDSINGQTFAWHDRFYHEIDVAVADIPGALVAGLNLEDHGDGGLRMTCLTCHFAHGTDVSHMQRRGDTWPADRQLVALSASLGTGLNTRTLRYFNPDNSALDEFDDGRFEACYICHDSFSYKPEVISSVPANGEYGVSATLNVIEIKFDLIINAEEIPQITVIDAGSNITEGVVSVDGTTVRYVLSSSLMEGKEYTVTVNNTKARIGGTLDEFIFTFYTYMKVDSHYPEMFAGHVSTDALIEVTFSNQVDSAIETDPQAAEKFSVTYVDDEEQTVVVPGTLSVDGHRLIFTATDGLPSEKTITVLLSSQIRSTSGVPLKTSYVWFFTTQ